MMRMLFRVLNSEPRANRRTERHDRGGARLLQFLAGDRVVVGVREDDEALFDKHSGRLEQGFVVREKRLLVADHFEFDEIREPCLPAEARIPDGVVGRVAAGRVRRES